MARNYKQGLYVPKNPKKYVGDFKLLKYKSFYELAVMKILDRTPSILKWQYEGGITIDYYSQWDNKWRKYHPDFFVQQINNKGEQETLVMEVKPYSQTIPPKKTKRKKETTYLQECNDWQVNSDKWEAARNFAKMERIFVEKIWGRVCC